MTGILDRVTPGKGELTLGVELPLDNDWSPGGQQARHSSGRLPGEPDMSAHHDRAVLVDQNGFAALWLRDVPLYDPTFGDAGQVYDPFPYLGYLAAATRNVALGTAAVVLPLRHPLHVAKMAATIDRLSGGRLVLGVASGDRPIEFPIFGVDRERRAAVLRDGVAALRSAWQDVDPAPDGLYVLPQPVNGCPPIVMAGRGGQSIEWIAGQLDGHFTYHRAPDEMAAVAADWHHSTGETFKPLLTTMLVDLVEDPDAPPTPLRFGSRLGRDALVRYLDGLRSAGVNHVAVNLRPSHRPVEAVIEEIAQHVLPEFPTPAHDFVRSNTTVKSTTSGGVLRR